ncbi:MAG: Xaa-Pro peptidase family protein [Candidatus Acidiferrum sp.]
MAQFKTAKIDALFITHPANLYYLTGFTGDAGALVMGAREHALVTDGRFTLQAAAETSGLRLVKQQASLYEAIGSYVKSASLPRVGYDARKLSVAQLDAVQRASGRSRWKAADGLVEGLRMVKEPQELAAMRRSAALASTIVMEAAKLLRPGVREFEVAAEIEYQMRKRGASGPAFETIVAFGSRAALPHARPTAKRLRKNELVVLDLGAILGHYCSDITRTFYFGRVPAHVRKWYQAVHEAQGAGIAAARCGASCGDVDSAARQVLAGYRLDGYFVHSTGHGLGLEVHEDPRLARAEKRRLEAGNVVTIEPGVYVQDVGGIRIEDDVAIHNGRTEVLTRAPRDLIEI